MIRNLFLLLKTLLILLSNLFDDTFQKKKTEFRTQEMRTFILGIHYLLLITQF